jgi:hypothetical protein
MAQPPDDSSPFGVPAPTQFDHPNWNDRYVPAHWPKRPQWRDAYPIAEDANWIADIVAARSINTIYYRGLADELVILALLRGNQDAQIIAWDYWGYWTSELCSADDVAPVETPKWPWPEGRVRFQLEGAPHRYPDLLILDSDQGASGQVEITCAKNVLLAGSALTAANSSRYQWTTAGQFGLGTARELSQTSADAQRQWSDFFQT